MAIEHNTLTDPELHEPKGVGGASDGQVYVADGLGSGVWTTLINKVYLTLDIADLSADTSYFIASPVDGLITKIQSVIDGVVATADVLIQAKLTTVNVTTGLVTITASGSAAGDYDEAIPTATNEVDAGDVIEFAVSGGGAGGTPRGHLVVEITLS